MDKIMRDFRVTFYDAGNCEIGSYKVKNSKFHHAAANAWNDLYAEHKKPVGKEVVRISVELLTQ